MMTSSGPFGAGGCVASLTIEAPLWPAGSIIFRTFSAPSLFRRQDLGGIVLPLELVLQLRLARGMLRGGEA
ncbi:hypothetical protein E2562_038407 [Oryza meyeriana var. granulata]|uniref:Uncharacterized protein n=1 Tax=Oryza meyeriana var. granulata TaxID=110450 RepID=A0A6G1E8L7_9ORYZ|nr:hypothetical protein E2562_038407 [Oryza meyeriana var. granulata]